MKIVILTYAKDRLNVASINRLVEEAELHGHTVERVRYADCSMGVVGGAPKIYHPRVVLEDADAVIPWIIQGDFSYGIDVLRHFESMGVFLLNGSEAFNNTSHKWRTAQILVAKNIPTPDTYRANNYKHMQRHIDGMSVEESVLKISTGTRGNGVILAPDKNTSKSIAGTLGICRDDYIVQEYIKESHGTDIRAYVVGDQVLASMERRSENDFRSNLHSGGTAKPVKLTKEEYNLAVATVHALGLSSAGVDLMRRQKGTCVIEANTSGEFGIEKITGVNVAGAIIEFIEQNVKIINKKDRVSA